MTKLGDFQLFFFGHLYARSASTEPHIESEKFIVKKGTYTRFKVCTTSRIDQASKNQKKGCEVGKKNLFSRNPSI